MDFLIMANLSKRIRKSILWQGITVTFILVFSGCFLDSEMQPVYGVAKTTKSEEFRWSDGGLPKVFDPALATASPKPTPVLSEIKPQAEVAEAPLTPTNPKPEPTPTPKPLGVEAIGDYALQVRLDQPDKDFPNLVAHPGFRPVHIETGSEISSPTAISNGAFELAQTGA